MFRKLILSLSICLSCCYTGNDKEDSLKIAIQDFTQEAYIYLAETNPNQNFVFSPLSLHSALSLVFLGAKDDSNTYHELKRALGGLVSPTLLKGQYQKYIQFLNDVSSVSYGNHLWVQENYKIKEDYREDVRNHLQSDISSLQFSSDEASQIVNNWISNVTNDKINKLIDGFSPESLMFLANALYFKESWLFPFEDTNYDGSKILEKFQTYNEEIEVEMMQYSSMTIKYEEFTTNDVTYDSVIIPYRGGDFQMKIILPQENSNHLFWLETFTNLTFVKDHRSKDDYNLFRIIGKDNYTGEVSVTMPPFKIRSKVRGKTMFENMHVNDLFTSKAELDKITDDKPVGISDILHEAVIDVTKNGTEGAAATGVEIVFFSASLEATKDIIVNKPFIFIIEDTSFGMPLLVGRVTNPLECCGED